MNPKIDRRLVAINFKKTIPKVTKARFEKLLDKSFHRLLIEK